MSASSLKLMIYIESLLGKATDFINTLCGIFFFSSVKMYFIIVLVWLSLNGLSYMRRISKYNTNIIFRHHLTYMI